MNTGVVVATGTINGTYEGFLYLAYLLPLIQGVLNPVNRLSLAYIDECPLSLLSLEYRVYTFKDINSSRVSKSFVLY
jgi:hypothetical protein